MPRHIISETEIRVDQAIIEEIFKPSPSISAQQIPSLLDLDIFRPQYGMLDEYTLLIWANCRRAFHRYFMIIMIRPSDWPYPFETLKDVPKIGNPKLLKFVNPIFDIGQAKIIASD